MSKAPREVSTDVATIDSGGLPAELANDLAQYTGAGLSDRQEDFQVPFLAVAQGLSPQMNRRNSQYIEGLQTGDLLNTATGESWRGEEGLLVLPVWFQMNTVEWVLRSEGGGWVATHPIDWRGREQARWSGENNRFLLLPNGHQLVDTAYWMVILAETLEPAVVAMDSTDLQCSRIWQSLVRKVKIPQPTGPVIAPAFARVYRLRSAYKENDKGSWYRFAVSDEGWSAGTKYHAAFECARKEFLNIQARGGIQMGRPPEAGVPDTSVEDDAPI